MPSTIPPKPANLWSRLLVRPPLKWQLGWLVPWFTTTIVCGAYIHTYIYIHIIRLRVIRGFLEFRGVSSFFSISCTKALLLAATCKILKIKSCKLHGNVHYSKQSTGTILLKSHFNGWWTFPHIPVILRILKTRINHFAKFEGDIPKSHYYWDKPHHLSQRYKRHPWTNDQWENQRHLQMYITVFWWNDHP